MLSEVYVPRDKFLDLMEQCRAAALKKRHGYHLRHGALYPEGR